MDRISELPTCIIHEIMSYLSAKEVGLTSVLSKRWYHLRNSFPILVFDQNDFFPEKIRFLHCQSSTVRKQKEKKFKKLVDDSLFRFCNLKCCMRKFALFVKFLDYKESTSLVDKWIGLAVDSGVKDLELNFKVSKGEVVYVLPQTVFSAKSLTALKLFQCVMKQPSETIRLDSLKKLTLDGVCINENMLQKLTNECALLEDFTISSCWGLKQLCILKDDKLKILEIRKVWGLEKCFIVVPSLQQLTFLFHVGIRRQYHLGVARVTHLTKLMLAYVDFINEMFDQFISNFPLLEDLTLGYCTFPGRIEISKNLLKNLQIFYCHNLEAIVADTPNLLSFTYSYNDKFNDPIPTVSMNALCPWEIRFLCKGNLDACWYLQLKIFLGVAKHIRKLKLSLHSCKVLVNLEELIECSYSLPVQVGNLELYANVPLSDYETLLDGIFLICHPRTLQVSTVFKEDRKLIEWLYEQQWIRDLKCCNSRFIKCWRHYLQDIKLQRYLWTKESFLRNEEQILSYNVRNHSKYCRYPFEGEVTEFNIDWCAPMLIHLLIIHNCRNC